MNSSVTAQLLDELLDELLVENVTGDANRLDSEPAVLRDKFRELLARGVLYDGDDQLTRLAQYTAIARHSAALAFLVKQHVVSTRLARTYFPSQFKPESTYGLALSCSDVKFNARKKVIRGMRRDGEIVLDGQAGWATGYGLLDTLVIDFFVDDAIHLGLVPFAPHASSSGHVACSEPYRTIAIQSTCTVGATFAGYAIPTERHVVLGADVDDGDLGPFANQSAILLGVVTGMIDDARAARDRPPAASGIPELVRGELVELDRRLAASRDAVIAAVRAGDRSTLLAQRVVMFDLGFAAYRVAAAGLGSAFAGADCSVHRRWRELALFEAQVLHPDCLVALLSA